MQDQNIDKRYHSADTAQQARQASTSIGTGRCERATHACERATQACERATQACERLHMPTVTVEGCEVRRRVFDSSTRSLSASSNKISSSSRSDIRIRCDLASLREIVFLNLKYSQKERFLKRNVHLPKGETCHMMRQRCPMERQINTSWENQVWRTRMSRSG